MQFHLICWFEFPSGIMIKITNISQFNVTPQNGDGLKVELYRQRSTLVKEYSYLASQQFDCLIISVIDWDGPAEFNDATMFE